MGQQHVCFCGRPMIAEAYSGRIHGWRCPERCSYRGSGGARFDYVEHSDGTGGYRLRMPDAPPQPPFQLPAEIFWNPNRVSGMHPKMGPVAFKQVNGEWIVEVLEYPYIRGYGPDMDEALRDCYQAWKIWKMLRRNEA